MVNHPNRKRPPKVTWTDAMDAALRRLRSDGVPIYECAERIGVAYPTAVHRCRELGIANRLNSGRRTGIAQLAQQD